MDQKIIDQKIREFARNNQMSCALHNMYYMYSEDMDGNVTGEAYAINACTDNGLRWVYGSPEDYEECGAPGTLSSMYYLSSSSYVGGSFHLGTSWPEPTLENPDAGTPEDPNFNSMYQPLITIGPQSTNETGLGRYQYTDLIFKDPYIIGVGRFIEHISTDYNYSGITTDKEIVEIGYTSKNPDKNKSDLFTLHARVVTADGTPTSFVKHLNEKITITVYTAYVIPYTVMKNAYDAGYNNNAWDLFSAQLLFINPQSLAFTKTASAFGKNAVDMMPHARYGYSYCLHNKDMQCGVNYQDIPIYSKEFDHLLNNNNGYDEIPNSGPTWKDFNDCDDSEVGTKHQIQHFSESPSLLFEEQNTFIDNYTLYKRVFNGSVTEDRYSVTYFSADWLCKKYIQQKVADADIIENNIFVLDNSNTSHYDDNYKMTNMFIDHAHSVLGESDYSKYHGVIPTQSGEMLEMKMFNVKTHAFDINETFSFHTDFLINTRWRQAGYVYMKDPNGTYRDTYVFMNPNPNYPITRFEETTAQIWCTDSWWDTSTWRSISNPTQVGSEFSQCRYYIAFQTNLTPRWDNDEPRLVPSFAYKANAFSMQRALITNYDMKTNRLLFNPTLRYLFNDRFITFLNENLEKTYEYSLIGPDWTETAQYGNTNDDSTHLFYYGNKLVLCSNKSSGYDHSKVRVYDVSDPTQQPTSIDLKCDNNTNYSSGVVYRDFDTSNTKPYMTFFDNKLNGNGKYCVQVLDVSQATQSDMVYEVEDAIKPFIIRNSNYMIYQDPTVVSNLSFKIYDMENKQVVKTINLSETYNGTYVGCVAYSTDGTLANTYIYFSITANNVTGAYYYDYATEIVTYISDGYAPSNQWTQEYNHDTVYACADCAVVLPYKTSSYNTAYVYDPNDPTTISSLPVNGGHGYLSYINEGRQLILGLSGQYYSRLHVVDIGRFLYDKQTILITSNTSNTSRTEWLPNAVSPSNSEIFMMIPYDKGILTNERCILTDNSNQIMVDYVPIEKFIQHYVKIKTRTFNAYNNPFFINGGIEISDCVTNITSRTSPI